MSNDQGNGMFPIGKSLVDDVSTVNYNSDGETFASEVDPMSLRHESDLLVLERASEHSRILTDDDASEVVWVGTAGNLRSLVDGASSVNTGSTYDEMPFLATYDNRTILQREPSWNNPDRILAPSHSAEDGYACEMLSETRAMIFQAKSSLDEYDADRFCRGHKQQSKNTAGKILGGMQAAFSACNDQLDAVLIRIFNVPVNEVETRPSYVVSLDESLTEDLRTFSDALVANKELDAPRDSRKHSKKDETFLIPMTVSETTANLSLQYSYSEMKDDLLDEVLGDDFILKDSKSRLSEEEVTHTVPSCKTEDFASKEFDRSPCEDGRVDDVRCDKDTMLNRVDVVTESRDDETATLESMEPEEEEINSNSTKADNDLQPTKHGSTMDEDDARDYGSRIQNNEQEVDTSFSRIHRQRVVDLINKNLHSTNRTEVIDLSHFDTDIDDTMSTPGFRHHDAQSLPMSNFYEGDPELRQGDKERDDSVRRTEKYRKIMKRLHLLGFQEPAIPGGHGHTSGKSTDCEEFKKRDSEKHNFPASFAETSDKMQTSIDLTMFEDFL
jgi:hypothetical protein